MSGANEKSTALEVIEAFKTDLTGYDVIITGANSGKEKLFSTQFQNK